MKILLIVTGDTGLQYHRQIVPHKVLHRNHGHEVRIVHDFDKVSDLELEYFDIVQFIRQISITGRTKEIIDRCHATGCKVVFDIDDNYNLPSDHGILVEKSLLANCRKYKQERGIELNDYERKQIPYKEYISNVREAIQYADLVTTTTEHLRNFIGKGEIIPNCIDMQEEQWQTKAEQSDKLRFGWIGGLWHEKDLELIKQSIGYVYSDKSLLNYQFVLGGFNVEDNFQHHVSEFHKNNPPYMYLSNPCYKARLNEIQNRSQYLRYEDILSDNKRMLSNDHKRYLENTIKSDFHTPESYRRVWGKSINQYATIYDTIDISLAPLRSNVFNNSKSELKVIEAAAKKKAIIVSDCLPYSVFPNDTVYKIATYDNQKGWYKAVKKFLNNRQMVDDYAGKIQEYVTIHYNLDKWTELRVELYESIL